MKEGTSEWPASCLFSALPQPVLASAPTPSSLPKAEGKEGGKRRKPKRVVNYFKTERRRERGERACESERERPIVEEADRLTTEIDYRASDRASEAILILLLSATTPSVRPSPRSNALPLHVYPDSANR